MPLNVPNSYVVVVPWEGGTCVPSKPESEQQLRYGLVVRIPGSHPGGPGSIPGNGKLFEKVFSWKALLSLYAQKLPEDSSERTRKILRRPGIEPGSTAWKAAMLTIIPPTLC